ncbi:WxL domain-containing protein [Carnobacterium divergens]|uniref:WxL domain-containing protein n=1 Tax=Carnobacterium divergens TaxID=2748 RepID=A0AAW8R9V9_CARDV|nr:WxL domain-containing protein [Carnobacterium divergens]MDT1957106.1 WxL domain-containing protein [Carnobacterium divergens]MDT1973076.1 WxL domain-containing protein [Carnobacterium divergens]
MNLKRTIVAGLFTVTTIMSMATPALATEGSKDGKGATSKAHVKLTPSDDSTDPTKPIEPSEPGGETGNKGPLTIDNVTPLEFSEHKLEGSTQEYTTTSKNPNVQITDNRGEGQGWTLQVTSSEFVDTKEETKVLKGAVVTLPTGQIKTTEGNVSPAPTAREVSLDTNQGTSETLITAAEKMGMGTWVDLFDANQVKVSVPGGNFAGEYTASLNWTLLDAATV